MLRYHTEVRFFPLSIFMIFYAATLLAQPASPAQKLAAAQCGPLAGQILQCPRFGFAYKVPFGWVDRTSEMHQEAQPVPEAESKSNEDGKADQKTRPNASSSGSETLLAVF